MHHTHTAVTGGQGLHLRVATLTTQLWLRRTARQSGEAGRQGGVGCRVGGGQDRVAGRVGWRARWGGWQGGVAGRVGRRAGWLEGMDLLSKECSGVNIVT